jgi:hypothetical protein
MIKAAAAAPLGSLRRPIGIQPRSADTAAATGKLRG